MTRVLVLNSGSSSVKYRLFDGTETLATAFWSLSGELDYAAAAPYATVVVRLTSTLLFCSPLTVVIS